jgi:hypothetical protein
MMQLYTPENPPKKGIAKQIWKVFVDAGLEPYDLHYNGGRRGIGGGGTWACALGGSTKNIIEPDGTQRGEFWCGIHGKTMVYLETMVAPYGKVIVGFTSRACPFYQRVRDRLSRDYYYGCKYCAMTGDWPEDCQKPMDCANCSDEYLTLRNNEYAKLKGGE